MKKNSCGDTLIEVSLALAILALVLISTYAVATRAFRLGQDAQIRRQVSAKMVEQAEELRNLRDNEITWGAFLGDIHLPLVAPFNTPPFYLSIPSGVPSLPTFNVAPEPLMVAGATISVTGTCSSPYNNGVPLVPGSDARGDKCVFTITGSWPSPQGSNNTSTMVYWLVNNKLLQAEGS